jgi:hypothetical protein
LTSYVTINIFTYTISHTQEEVNQQNHNLVTKAITLVNNLRLLLGVKRPVYLIFRRVLRGQIALELQILSKMELYTLLNLSGRVIIALEDRRK